MRAAVLREHGEPLDVTDVPAPTLDSEGVVVDVEACGICRSDWHAWMGHGEWADDNVEPGQILGHEPAGRVVEVGDRVETIREGDRVALPFNLACGSCGYCRTGHGNVCTGAHPHALGFEQTAQGAFAEQVHLPSADYNAIRLPAGVTSRDVAALGCRFMTAYNALEARAGLRAGEWVAIHGCGGVGLSAIQVANALGARVVAVDVRESALDVADELGADVLVDAADADVVESVRDATDGGAHVSVDALGVAETCRNSVRCVRPRGTHVQVGLTTAAERGEVSLPTDWMTRHEVSFVGARGMPPTSAPDLLSLLASDTVDPGSLVTKEVSLDEVPERLAAMTDYDTVGVEVMTM
ncbi:MULTISPECIES: zinc-dependent alcohol dehydrogenase family protein [Haloferax]|uniref:Zinc-binding dehydrogenase n=1 Tax=Haloferax marinum TaxID=2666143 RepID=A0A6A8GAC6_9EURY|nr:MULTISPECIES: zinc-dependent alcohol dehydrogenase family protein [Haloferax]KAB1198440.1 zinc-dependent alcohol dehydrogenase family protein [Haloferax sp. CBA1150]MRW97542.1 zinc-binding dehydrogenase [Haloferax marinum]